MIVWIVGRPSSGKTTLGRALVEELQARGRRATLVDSDEVRAAITPQPTYTPAERATVYRAIAYVARRLAEQDLVAVVAATAHQAARRGAAREVCGGFFLIYARCPAEVCERRDSKGLYRRARASSAGAMPGVHVAFEEPTDADLAVETDREVDVPWVVDAVLARG